MLYGLVPHLACLAVPPLLRVVESTIAVENFVRTSYGGIMHEDNIAPTSYKAWIIREVTRFGNDSIELLFSGSSEFCSYFGIRIVKKLNAECMPIRRYKFEGRVVRYFEARTSVKSHPLINISKPLVYRSCGFLDHLVHAKSRHVELKLS